MKLHVEVTQDDIDQGCAKDAVGEAGGCMIWRAFQRATEGAFPHVEVQFRDIRIYDESPLKRAAEGEAIRPRYKLRHEQMNRIRAFDTGSDVEPFAFDLEMPDELLTGAQG